MQELYLDMQTLCLDPNLSYYILGSLGISLCLFAIALTMNHLSQATSHSQVKQIANAIMIGQPLADQVAAQTMSPSLEKAQKQIAPVFSEVLDEIDRVLAKHGVTGVHVTQFAITDQLEPEQAPILATQTAPSCEPCAVNYGEATVYGLCCSY